MIILTYHIAVSCKLILREVVTIEPIRRVDLQTEIINKIKAHIYDNRLQPGDPLPSQAAMCGMLGASRPSIREAIKTMEAQGLVRVMNGKGIYVEQIDTSFHTDTTNTAYNVKLLQDAMSVRKVLEGMAVEQCTVKAMDEQLLELSGILSQVEDRYYRGEAQSDLDLLYHRTLIDYAGNRLLSNMLRNLVQHSSGLWRMEDPVAAILSDSIPSHRIVMDHMLARDADAAVREHNKYMDRTLAALQSIVDQADHTALE